MLVGVVREMLARAPAPRNVFVRFRLGQVFGEPGHVVQQRAILAAALAALFTVRRPGAIVELPYRWKRNAYKDPLAAPP
ncbi:MAG TPA: hypothetical protein VEU55_00805 [Gemmatimonadales bacterium]|nr:hypothetical protein [Gemmatimonadales bacterium]